MGRPVRFVCRGVSEQTPEEMAAQILDPACWTSFRGWGPLPGIEQAEMEPVEGVVGTLSHGLGLDLQFSLVHLQVVQLLVGRLAGPRGVGELPPLS